MCRRPCSDIYFRLHPAPVTLVVGRVRAGREWLGDDEGIKKTETEIAQLNERVARAMGYELNPNYRTVRWWHPRKNYSDDLPPDFYRDIRLVGEMMEWLMSKGFQLDTYTGFERVAVIVLPNNQEPGAVVTRIEMKTLPACLCRAIDAVVKEATP